MLINDYNIRSNSTVVELLVRANGLGSVPDIHKRFFYYITLLNT